MKVEPVVRPLLINICVAELENADAVSTNWKVTLPTLTASCEPVTSAIILNEPDAFEPPTAVTPAAFTDACAGVYEPSKILTTVALPECFKYSLAVCEVKYWYELEPLLKVSPKICTYSLYEFTTVGVSAGPLTVGPIIHPPISPIAAGKKLWSISFVKTPGLTIFSAIWILL